MQLKNLRVNVALPVPVLTYRPTLDLSGLSVRVRHHRLLPENAPSAHRREKPGLQIPVHVNVPRCLSVAS